MKMIHAVAGLALVAPLLLQRAASSRAQTMSWQDAVGQLGGQRGLAESCIAQLKKYGNDAQRDRGDLSYARAKADSDAVLEGVKTALSLGEKPALSVGETPPGLPSLLTKLRSSLSGLIAFCDEVEKLIPTTPAQKGYVDEIVKVTIEQLIKPLSDAISTLYTNYRNAKALTKAEIETQLDVARWPKFSEVKAAQ